MNNKLKMRKLSVADKNGMITEFYAVCFFDRYVVYNTNSPKDNMNENILVRIAKLNVDTNEEITPEDWAFVTGTLKEVAQNDTTLLVDAVKSVIINKEDLVKELLIPVEGYNTIVENYNNKFPFKEEIAETREPVMEKAPLEEAEEDVKVEIKPLEPPKVIATLELPKMKSPVIEENVEMEIKTANNTTAISSNEMSDTLKNDLIAEIKLIYDKAMADSIKKIEERFAKVEAMNLEERENAKKEMQELVNQLGMVSQVANNQAETVNDANS